MKKSERTSRLRTPISKASTPYEIGEFWDTHDFTDFEDRCPEVTNTVKVSIRRVRHLVSIEPEVLRRARQVARKRRMPTESLINLWLSQAVERAGNSA